MSKIGKLRDLAEALLHEHKRDGAIPTSARFLYYELTQSGVLSKTPSGARRPEQDLIDALKDLRDAGRIPWDWLEDEIREVSDCTGYPSIREGVLTILAGIRLDPWDGNAPLILTESRAVAGALRPVVREFRVRIAATGGQVGGFLHTEIAPLLSPGTRVIYFGDLDLCGGQIENNTRRVLEQEVGKLAWERLALTKTQVDYYKLPPKPKRDRRYNDGHPHEAFETEAIKQHVLVGILRTRLEELLPEPLAHVQEREKRQRKQIAKRIAADK